jgi:transcription initiation factor TFIID TATA-box-binding protein
MSTVRASITIENIVASVTLQQNIDLNSVVKTFPNVEYRPERFPGLVFRLKTPKTATLIFSTGKMVCTGARSEKQAKQAVRKVVRELKNNGIVIMKRPIIKVVNMVASVNLRGGIDLERTIYTLDRTMFEPEQFPGLIYRMTETKVVFLLFTSGKCYASVIKLRDQLEQNALLVYE